MFSHSAGAVGSRLCRTVETVRIQAETAVQRPDGQTLFNDQAGRGKTGAGTDSRPTGKVTKFTN